MLKLPNVTVACVDAINPGAQHLIPVLQRKIEFGDSVFIDKDINSVQDYNSYILNELHKSVSTSHCLIVQVDGFPIMNSSWTDDFLEYDYIGAPWIDFPEMPEKEWVGNGGFSLRSKALMEAVASLNSDGNVLEDNFICVDKRELLESKGFKFAPVEVAKKFSVENDYYVDQFGFHGKVTIEMNVKAGIFK